MSETINITVTKWNDFNPMSDRVRHPYWFKIHMGIAFSYTLSGLLPEQKWLWICILTECCRKKSNATRWTFDGLSKFSGVSKKSIFQALEIFSERGALTIDRQSIVSPSSTEERREEKRRGETTIVQIDFGRDIERVYLTYPRKEGKKRGMKKLVAMIKTKDDLAKFEVCTKNYISHCAVEGREAKFIKLWSTFAEEYEDWAQPPPAAAADFSIAQIRQREREENERLRIRYEHEKNNPGVSSVFQGEVPDPA